VRTSILLFIAVAGCAVDPPEISVQPQALDNTTALSFNIEHPRGIGVCNLAAQLPADELCAHICDMDAMRAQLVAGGEAPGTCVEFRCNLPDASSVVGVCVPPN
jgi:hypothetical protein